MDDFTHGTWEVATTGDPDVPPVATSVVDGTEVAQSADLLVASSGEHWTDEWRIHLFSPSHTEDELRDALDELDGTPASRDPARSAETLTGEGVPHGDWMDLMTWRRGR